MTEFPRPQQQPRSPEQRPQTPTNAVAKFLKEGHDAILDVAPGMGIAAGGIVTFISAINGDLRNACIYGGASLAAFLVMNIGKNRKK